MKKTVIISVVLIMLAVAAWAVQIGTAASLNAQIKTNVDEAKKYYTEGLYQKAIDSYTKALLLKESESIRTAWLDANSKAYEDGVIEYGDYEDALELACEQHPENVSYWESLLDFCIENSKFSKGYDVLQKISREKITSDIIEQQYNTIMYSFSTSRKTYNEFYRSPEGIFVVSDDNGWGVVDSEGERVIECDYQYISPYNQKSQAVFVSEKGVRLLNEAGVVEALLSMDVLKARACENGLVPVCDESGVWKYYDSETGQYILESYEDASSFVDGIAAVRKNGKWQLINKDNESQCDTQFDDIKLHGNGDYAYKGIMIASVNGKYGIYDEKGKEIGKAAYLEMDIYLGDNIAFKDASGKWGFVNKKGDVVVEPVYAGAKSFSNGMAAVSDGESWGYINEKATLVIDYQFHTADYFTKDGFTIVSESENVFFALNRRFS